MKRVVLLALLALVAALAAGCADDDEPAGSGESVSVYLLIDDKVWPVSRNGDDPEAALEELLAGPSDEEASELDATTAIPEGTEIDEFSLESGLATVVLSDMLEIEATAQVVYTLTQFPEVESVDIQGGTLARGGLEEQTPSILVESPLAFSAVSPGFTATGTANTFEANFNYEVLDADGEVLDENFVTATSGTGTRGTFEFTPDLTADDAGEVTLVVYEVSAEDGSRFREWRIPLELEE